MEESSERRRERLRALREEASLANNDEEIGGSCVATPPGPRGLPFPGDLQQPAPVSPPPRFEFYTDPLAAFSGSQKKKSKNSLGSPFSGPPAPPPCKSPPSPFWQPDSSNLNPNLRPPGNLNTPGIPNPYPNLPPPGNSNPNPHHFSVRKLHLGSFNTPSSNPNHNSYSSPHQSSIPGKFTPGSADFNPNRTPEGGYSNPGPSMHGPQSGFGSPQPLSASQMYNGGGSGGPSMNTPAPYQYNRGRGGFSTDSPQHQVGGMNDVSQMYNGGGSGGPSTNTPAPYQYNRGRGGFSTDSPPQHHVGGRNDVRNNGWSQSGMNSGRSQGSNHSRGSFMQSPGSTGRDNRTSGRSGGRGFQRSHNDASATTNPELFAKRSMLLDPWKDLLPVRFESVAFRLNACSVMGSRDWLPKSVSKGMVSPNTKGVTVSTSGPSLAESLAASYADAVLGEDGA